MENKNEIVKHFLTQERLDALANQVTDVLTAATGKTPQELARILVDTVAMAVIEGWNAIASEPPEAARNDKGDVELRASKQPNGMHQVIGVSIAKSKSEAAKRMQREMAIYH